MYSQQQGSPCCRKTSPRFVSRHRSSRLHWSVNSEPKANCALARRPDETILCDSLTTRSLTSTSVIAVSLVLDVSPPVYTIRVSMSSPLRGIARQRPTQLNMPSLLPRDAQGRLWTTWLCERDGTTPHQLFALYEYCTLCGRLNPSYRPTPEQQSSDLPSDAASTRGVSAPSLSSGFESITNRSSVAEDARQNAFTRRQPSTVPHAGSRAHSHRSSSVTPSIPSGRPLLTARVRVMLYTQRFSTSDGITRFADPVQKASLMTVVKESNYEPQRAFHLQMIDRFPSTTTDSIDWDTGFMRPCVVVRFDAVSNEPLKLELSAMNDDLQGVLQALERTGNGKAHNSEWILKVLWEVEQDPTDVLPSREGTSAREPTTSAYESTENSLLPTDITMSGRRVKKEPKPHDTTVGLRALNEYASSPSKLIVSTEDQTHRRTSHRRFDDTESAEA